MLFLFTNFYIYFLFNLCTKNVLNFQVGGLNQEIGASLSTNPSRIQRDNCWSQQVLFNYSFILLEGCPIGSYLLRTAPSYFPYNNVICSPVLMSADPQRRMVSADGISEGMCSSTFPNGMEIRECKWVPIRDCLCPSDPFAAT